MAVKNTSVTVDFEGSSSSDAYTWETDSTKAVDPTIYPFEDHDASAQAVRSVWLRLSPVVGTPRVRATAGTISYRNTESSRKRSTVSFTGSDSASLGENLTSVTLALVGAAFNLDGLAVAVSFSYDPITGNVKASQECYAVVEAVYTYSYRLYYYTYSGSCPYKDTSKPEEESGGGLGGGYSEDEADEEPAFKSAVVWAIDEATARQGSINLTGPTCTYSGTGTKVSNSGVGGVFPTVIFEVVWSGLRGSENSDDVYPVTIFRVWPGEATFTMVNGHYRMDVQSRSLDIDTLVNFNGSNSQLPRPPMSSVSAEFVSVEALPRGDTGDYYPEPQRIATPGDTVVDVNWNENGTYTVKGQKIVGPQELVLTTVTNAIVPGKAMVNAKYTSSFAQFVAYHDWGPNPEDEHSPWVPMDISISGEWEDGTGSAVFSGPQIADKAKDNKEKRSK